MAVEETMALLRRMQHDFANHMQVISGYLQLQNYTRVEDYVQKVIQQMNDDRVLFTSLRAEAALYLFQQKLAAQEKGITLIYHDLEIEKIDILRAQNEPLVSLCSFQEAQHNNDLTILLSIKEKRDEESVHLSFSASGSREKIEIRL